MLSKELKLDDGKGGKAVLILVLMEYALEV